MDKYYIDRPLTNVAVARKSPKFLAERLFPVVSHPEPSGLYYIHDANDAALIVQNTKRAPGSSPHSMYNEAPTTQNFSVEDHSLQDTLPDEYNRTMSASLMRESNKVERLVDQLNLGKEVNLLTRLAAGTGSGGLTQASTPSIKFDVVTGTTLDPILYLMGLYPGIEDAIGASPNVAAMDISVARTIINHPAVKERAMPTMGPDRYNTSIGVMETILAQLLGLDEVLISAGSLRNTARKKETKTIVRNWGKNMVIGYKEAPNLEGYGGMGLHIKWAPPAEEGEEVLNGMLVERERLDDGRKAWGFYVHDYYKQIVVNNKAGLWVPSVLT